jgi:hypothetical protein
MQAQAQAQTAPTDAENYSFCNKRGMDSDLKKINLTGSTGSPG